MENAILMLSENTAPTLRDLALRRCQELIDWYEQARRRHRHACQFFQAAAIVLSGLTPALIV